MNRTLLVVVVQNDKKPDDGQKARNPECLEHDKVHYVNSIPDLGRRPVENPVEILWKNCGSLWKKTLVGRMCKST